MAKSKFYVVWHGVEPGIYTDWDKCKQQINGFEGAIYKSFATREEAEEAYHSSPYSTILRGYVCYWSSSLNVDNCNQAYCLHDFIGTVNVEGVLEPYCKDRCLGYTVRAVAE